MRPNFIWYTWKPFFYLNIKLEEQLSNVIIYFFKHSQKSSFRKMCLNILNLPWQSVKFHNCHHAILYLHSLSEIRFLNYTHISIICNCNYGILQFLWPQMTQLGVVISFAPTSNSYNRWFSTFNIYPEGHITLYLNEKNLSIESTRDSKSGLDTIDPN